VPTADRVADDGCPFATRCPHAVDVCRRRRPELETTPDGAVACHRWRELRRAAATGAAVPAAGKIDVAGPIEPGRPTTPTGPACLATDMNDKDRFPVEPPRRSRGRA
jgi:hypothetical protein